jgi:hypothetical protein
MAVKTPGSSGRARIVFVPIGGSPIFARVHDALSEQERVELGRRFKAGGPAA